MAKVALALSGACQTLSTSEQACWREWSHGHLQWERLTQEGMEGKVRLIGVKGKKMTIIGRGCLVPGCELGTIWIRANNSFWDDIPFIQATLRLGSTRLWSWDMWYVLIGMFRDASCLGYKIFGFQGYGHNGSLCFNVFFGLHHLLTKPEAWSTATDPPGGWGVAASWWRKLQASSAAQMWSREVRSNPRSLGHSLFSARKGKLPSGNLTQLWKITKSPFLMGKSTISMAIFNSYVKLPEGRNKSCCSNNKTLFRHLSHVVRTATSHQLSPAAAKLLEWCPQFMINIIYDEYHM